MSTPPPPPDPTGDRYELACALADPRLDAVADDGTAPADAQDAAVRLAVAVGRCRLFGIRGGEADGVLPPPFALAACDGLARMLNEWAVAAGQFQQAWDDCPDPDEADRLAVGWVQARTTAHAAVTAVEDALDLYEEQALPDADPLARRLDAVLTVGGPMDAFDAALKEHRDLLGLVADTIQVADLRRRLVGSWLDPIPWWVRPVPVAEVAKRVTDSPVLRQPEYSAGTFAPDTAFGPGQEIVWANASGTEVVIWRLPAGLGEGDWRTTPGKLLAKTVGDGKAARVGRPFRLNDYTSGRFDAHGRAEVAPADVSADPTAPLRLWVGDDPAEWFPVSEVPDDA